MQTRHKVALGVGGIALCVASILPNEGLRLKAYRDGSPAEIWTYCVGETTRPDGSPVRKGDTATKPECMARLSQRLEKDFIPGVEACITKPMLVPVEVAFVDTAYNTGIGGFCKGVVAKLWNEGKFLDSCKALLTFHTLPNSEAHKGLVNRRKKASDLCLSGL